MCFKRGPTIPYPMEKFDSSATLENIDVLQIFESFLILHINLEHRQFFQEHLQLYLDDTYPTAGVWEDPEDYYHLIMHPGWVNYGVIRHEVAHISFDLLTGDQKILFGSMLVKLKATDELIIRLFKKYTYGLKNDIEAHAEIYRYLCEQMPEELKQFYPNLF